MATAVRSRGQRGISLIEALVAMAVMAFGMLGIVGVQATLRLNADIAKQRSEALRLGERAIEDMRSYSQIGTSVSAQDYVSDIVSGTTTLTAADTGATNTSYTIQRNVIEPADLRMKVLQVVVRWDDRTGHPQSVVLNSAIAGIPPDLAGTLLLAANVDANGVSTRTAFGRSRMIPVNAVDIGGGSSGFMPPDGGIAALVFDNLTGVVKLCETTASSTAALTATNITNCSTDPGQLLSGTIRFANNVVSPTAADSENPTGSALNLDVDVTLSSTAPSPGRVCFDDAPTTATAAALRTFVNYFCVVLSDSTGKWSGRSFLVPRGLDANPAWSIAASGVGNLKVCRYTTLPGDTGTPLQNPLHPRSYTDVVSAQVLANQNFLVIRADANCPTDVAADPANGNFVNSNTRQQQP